MAAQLIKKETTDASGNVDVATNAMAHAVWGAVSSQMSGGSAAAGAAGAFSGELATRYIAEKYWGADTPEKIAALGQEDREQLSLLGTLAAGLAGGMVGNSSAAATSGAVAGKNAVENNALSVQENQSRVQEMSQCQGNKACERAITRSTSSSQRHNKSVLWSVQALVTVLTKRMKLAGYRLIMLTVPVICWKKPELMAV